MDRLISIYVLRDPRDDAVHYVGQSFDPSGRLAQHFYDVTNCSKGAWIAELLILHLVPRIEVVEAVSPQDAKSREQWWISEMRQRGEPLTNCRSGTSRADVKRRRIEDRNRLAALRLSVGRNG